MLLTFILIRAIIKMRRRRDDCSSSLFLTGCRLPMPAAFIICLCRISNIFTRGLRVAFSFCLCYAKEKGWRCVGVAAIHSHCKGWNELLPRQPPLTCTALSAIMQIWRASRFLPFTPFITLLFYTVFWTLHIIWRRTNYGRISRSSTFPPDYHSVFHAIFRVCTNHKKSQIQIW